MNDLGPEKDDAILALKSPLDNETALRERPWLWIPLCMIFALLVYFAGAITARVMFEHGRLHRESPTFRALEFVYTPLQALSDSSPRFLRFYEACVGVFVPEKKDNSKE